MAFRSRKKIYDSNTPSISSSRTSMNGALYRRSSKETIQSYKGSISNSSVHTTSTAATRKDLLDCSELDPGGDPSISHLKSSHFLEKSMFRSRNQSQSTVSTIREAGSVSCSTATSTSEQETRSLNVTSFEDEDEPPLPSTPRSSVYNLSTLPEPSPSSSRLHGVPPSTPLGDPLTKPYGDSQLFATREIPTADKPPAKHPSSLPPPTDRMVTPSLPHITPSSKESRRALKITVEYHNPSRQSIQEYQELLSNANIHAAAAASYKDPFVPTRQAPPPPSPHNPSKPFSRSLSRQSIQEYLELLSNVNIHAAAAASYKDPFVPTRQAPPPPSSHNLSKPSSRNRDRDSSISHHKSRNSLHKQPPRSRGRPVSTAPTTIHEADSDPFSTAPSTPLQEFSSFTLPSTREMATSPLPPTPRRPSRANTVNLTDLYVDPNPNHAHGPAPTPLLDPGEPYGDPQSFVTAPSSTAFSPSPSVAVTSFSSHPVDRMGTVSRSSSGTVTAKDKKGMLGVMTDFLNSNKRPEISTPYDPIQLPHVGFDLSTRKYTGLPNKFYQEHHGGGDIWDKMGHWQPPAQGISPPPTISGAAPAAYPGAPNSVNASTEGSRDSPNADDAVRSQATVASNGTVVERPAPQQRSATVASLAKAAGATPRRREKKKEDKANDADIVRRLQQICTDADPTRLYRNLVKIGQG
jgi:hypothetical protein